MDVVSETSAVSSRQVILGHAVAERIAGHFQETAGFRDIAGCLSQRFFEHPFFHVLKRQAEGEERRRGTLAYVNGRGDGFHGGW